MHHLIALAQAPEQVLRCLPIMLELRTHLKSEAFVERIERQKSLGYHLAYPWTSPAATLPCGYSPR